MGRLIDLEAKRSERMFQALDEFEQERLKQFRQITRLTKRMLSDAMRKTKVTAQSPGRQRREAAEKALSAVETILGWFVRTYPPHEAIGVMRLVSKTLADAGSVRARRNRCVSLIDMLAHGFEDPRVPTFLARELGLADPGLADIEPSAFVELLRSFAKKSRGKSGARGAERILAELMVSDQRDALGIIVNMSSDVESEIERIRKILAGKRDKSPRYPIDE